MLQSAVFHQGVSEEELQLGKLNLFVGANNTGKSLVCSELYRQIKTASQQRGKWVKAIKAVFPSKDEYISHITTFLKNRPSENRYDLSLPSEPFSTTGEEIGLNLADYEKIVSGNDPHNENKFIASLLRPNTIKLDYAKRFSLVKDQRIENLASQHPKNHLEHLYKNKIMYETINKYTKVFLDQYITLDWKSSPPTVTIKLSEFEIPYERMEDMKDFSYFDACKLTSEYSDGSRAILGLLLGVFIHDSSLVFIDEPELYLHPAWCYQLGRIIAEHSRNSSAQFFISTHSPEFLAGCADGFNGLNIFFMRREMTAPQKVIQS